MLAITQTEYYLTLLKYLAVAGSGLVAAVVFFGIVYAIVFYSHYWR